MINVAILGAGIGAQHFSSYKDLTDRFDVRWVIDIDLEKATQLTAETTTSAGSSINDVLHDPEIDLIDICLPPHLHVPVTLDALSYGKHVICEKPLATSLEDVAGLRNAVKKHQRQIFPVFQYRWGPGLAKLRHLIRCGIAGKPYIASAETHWNRSSDYYAIPWRGTWAGEQGGAILGHAIHSHDLLTQIMGPAASVSASLTTRVNDIETEDCAAVSIEFANGALGTSSVSLGAAKDETRLRFVFEHLTATSGTNPYDPASGDWEFAARNPGDQAKLDECLSETPPELNGFSGFLAAVSNELSGMEVDSVTFEDGAKSIELVTAIYDAARTGRRVYLPLEDHHPLYQGWTP